MSAQPRTGRPEAVSFALWQTLIDENPRFHRAVQSRRARAICALAALHGRALGIDEAARAYRMAADTVEAEWMEGVPVDNRRRVEMILAELDLELPKGGAECLVHELEGTHRREGIVLDVGAAAVLADLSREFALYVVSDSWMTPSHEVIADLEGHGIARYFRGMMFSDRTGVAKITGDAFRTLSATTGIDLARLVHVGDLAEVDVRGAQLAGVAATVLVRRPDHPVRFPRGSGTRPSATITVDSLREVPTAIRGL